MSICRSIYLGKGEARQVASGARGGRRSEKVRSIQELRIRKHNSTRKRE